MECDDEEISRKTFPEGDLYTGTALAWRHYLRWMAGLSEKHKAKLWKGHQDEAEGFNRTIRRKIAGRDPRTIVKVFLRRE